MALSSIIFGFIPVLTKEAYDGGVNWVTLTFLRTTMALPIILAFIRGKDVSLRVTKKQLFRLIILGVFGLAFATILLYGSYSFISIGLATSIHFVYPVIIVIVCAIFFKEKIDKRTVIALLLVTIGVLTFVERSSKSAMIGFWFALISGVFHSFYVLYTDKSGIKNIHYFKMTFYVCLVASIVVFIFGVSTKQLSFEMTNRAWIYSFLVSFLSVVVAIPLFQVGIRETGASTAGILSTLEPITSVAFGIMLLGEQINVLKLLGCVLIVVGVVLVEFK